MNNGNMGACIDVYDGDSYAYSNTFSFEAELKDYVDNIDIAQFYVFGDYVYIRNYSDYGIIGKMVGKTVEPILISQKLRIAHNSKGTEDDYHVFFMREGSEYYMLNSKEGSLLKGELKLDENESIRGAIANGTDVCIGMLDESETRFLSTKKTCIYSYMYLLENADEL